MLHIPRVRKVNALRCCESSYRIRQVGSHTSLPFCMAARDWSPSQPARRPRLPVPVATHHPPMVVCCMTAMDLARSAAIDTNPPPGITSIALALWFAKAGKWEAAHDLCQNVPGTAATWIHAHLHREEGDLSNAAYWYSRACKSMPASTVTLEDEWRSIASELIG